MCSDPYRQLCTTFLIKNWYKLFNLFLKGQSNEIFDLNCFSLFESAWATDQWVETYSILVMILLSYLIFRFKNWLAGVWYPWESCFGGFFIDSSGYDTLGRLTRRGMMLRGDWLAGVSHPREIDSSGYHTPGDLKNWITRRIPNKNQSYWIRERKPAENVK